MIPRNLAAGMVAILALHGLAMAENWPQFRGPMMNGSTSETGLPESCDPSTAAWSLPLPGPGHSTPIVWGDRVFLTSTDPATKGLLAICIDARNGKILWQKRLGDDIKAPQNNGATPSPATDGKHVWFLFGSGDLAALDMDGAVIWSLNLVRDYGNLATKFGYSSSPLLWDGRLYLQLLRRDKPYSGAAGSDTPLESLVLALDPLTGKCLWKHVRKSDAVDESHESYSSPVPFQNKTRKELLIQGGDCLSGHDPTTGNELWRHELNPERNPIWRLIPSPLVDGDMIFATLPRGGPLVAYKSAASGPPQQVWRYEERTSDSGTPLFYQGMIYILQSDKSDAWNKGSKSSPGIFLLVIDPATGKETGRCKIAPGGAWRTSPTGADGKIHVMSEKGEVVVVSAGSNGKVLSRTDYDDGPACSTLTVANGRIFIRTASKLTCFGKQL